MATATKTVKGFKVTCPFCNDEGSTVKLDLNDLTNCTCTNCDAEFSPREAAEKAAEQLRRWQAVLAWTNLAGEALTDPE